MTHIFYSKETGQPLYTLEGKTYPDHLVTETVGVITTTLDVSDLGCWQVVEGELVKVNIEPIREEALAHVNEVMRNARLQFITPLPAQEMIYLRKESEARAYIEDPAPDLLNYPLIAAETGTTAPDAWSVAQIWLNMSYLWVTAAAALEPTRLAAVAALDAATTEIEIQAALDAFNLAMSVLMEA